MKNLIFLTLFLPVIGFAQSPMITEFMADNVSGILDQDSDASDWIEVLNPSSDQVSMSGWALTDDPENLKKWTFSSNARIPAGESIVVFASSKDRASLFAGELHTNFRLEGNNGYLALVDPDGVVASEYVDYPKQHTNISYGRTGDSEGYYFPATPEEPNKDSEQAPPDKVTYSVEAKTFTEPFTVELSSTDPDVTIYYTLDGKEPTNSLFNTSYSEPIEITETTRLRTRAYKDGAVPGELDYVTYFQVDAELAAFSSDLPVVIVDSFGTNVDSRPRHGDRNPVSSYFIDRNTE
ncbi:MAG: chitobiase/beta-hexosaminidase C-terminal domain-containing protein, partial [Verrucomicrobiota bacterium]